MNNVLNIALYSLRRSFWIILGWGIPLMLLGIITIPFYDLVAENEKQLRPVLDTLKPSLRVSLVAMKLNKCSLLRDS